MKNPAPHRAVSVLVLATLLASLGVSTATVALPDLARNFLAPVSHLQWVVLAYLLSVTVFIVVAGRLGDQIGDRKVLLIGLGIFSASSAVCAAAPVLNVLIAARMAQGVGGAVLMALPISIIRDRVPKERTGAAMGLMGTMSAIGTALGPSIGGLIIAWSGWRLAFLVLAIAGIAVFILAAREIHATQNNNPGRWNSLDLPGALVLALALVSYSLLMTGLSSGRGAANALLLVMAVTGAMAFALIERRRTNPLVQLAVLGRRQVSAALLMNLLVSCVMMATLTVGPLFLAFSLGLSDAFTGMVMAVGPAASAVSGIPAGHMADRFGSGRMVLVGLVQIFVALWCFALLPGFIGVAGYVLSLMLLTPGFQMFLAANNTFVMMMTPGDQRGMISGLLGLSRNLGFITGASAMAAIFSLWVGVADITLAPPAVIGAGFSLTFIIAAGLIALAILLTLTLILDKGCF